MERVATRSALNSWDIQLPLLLCPPYGDHEENAEHLLTSCSTANMVWSYISAWFKIQLLFAFSIKDLLNMHKTLNVPAKKQNLFQVTILTACQCIWKARNDKVFEDSDINLGILFQDIKSQGFKQVKNRSIRRNLVWKDLF